MSIGLAASLGKYCVVCRDYRAVGANGSSGTAIGTEDERIGAGDLVKEPIEIQQHDVFNEKSVPTRKGRNVVLEREKEWRWCERSNWMVESCHQEEGLVGKVNGCCIQWEGRYRCGWLWVEETVPFATVSLLVVALEGVFMSDVKRLGRWGEEGEPFVAEPAGALVPLSKGTCQKEVFSPILDTGAAAVEESSGKDSSPDLEAGLAGSSLVGP